jgi:hypothetical protein
VVEMGKHKIFISWSGKPARDLAVALHAWLPKIFDGVQPWVSDIDIASGTRNMREIEEQLADSTFGIILLNRQNQASPWINFEAGALSKTVGDISTQVVPLLIDFEEKSDYDGPLRQFQSKLANREDIGTLIGDLADVVGADRGTAVERLEAFWDRIAVAIDDCRSALSASTDEPDDDRSEGDKLDEALVILRDLRGRLPAPGASDASNQRLVDQPAEPDGSF